MSTNVPARLRSYRPRNLCSRSLMGVLLLLVSPAPALCGTGNPANPFKSWAPWKPTRFRVDYPVVLRLNENEVQLWFSAGNRGMDRIFGFVGPHLGSLKDTNQIIKFGADIIKGYDRPLNGIRYPLITRASCAVLKDGTHVVLSAIGPRYQGGSELFPALFVSPDGKPGTWKHLGPPAGDPADWIAKARALKGRFRIEGGSIFDLGGGRLRMYIHGFKDPKDMKGPRLCTNSMFIAEAANVEGPWRFLKDPSGRCIDITKGLTPDCNWLFPNVMKIGEHGYMLTGGNKWPPTSTWAAFSVDGIRFEIPCEPGQKPAPVFRPADISPKATSMKVLRGAYNPANGMFEAVANISNRGWHVHHSKTAFDVDVFKRITKAKGAYVDPLAEEIKVAQALLAKVDAVKPKDPKSPAYFRALVALHMGTCRLGLDAKRRQRIDKLTGDIRERLVAAQKGVMDALRAGDQATWTRTLREQRRPWRGTAAEPWFREAEAVGKARLAHANFERQKTQGRKWPASTTKRYLEYLERQASALNEPEFRTEMSRLISSVNGPPTPK